MAIVRYKGKKPLIGKGCFIAPTASIIGDVTIGPGCGIWFGAVLRGDLNAIRIGRNVSIQDNCVLHTDKDKPAEMGDDVAVGHGAIIHSASIGSNTLIGMGAILLSGCKVGNDCIIGAGSVVTEGTEIPDGSIAMGIPAKVVKATTKEHLKRITDNVHEYSVLRDRYLK